jgi:histidine triad (HIT) family protein
VVSAGYPILICLLHTEHISARIAKLVKSFNGHPRDRRLRAGRQQGGVSDARAREGGPLLKDHRDSCPFCAAALGAPVTPVVYESAEVMGLFPQSPAALGHTLVIPKKHVTDVWALGKSDAHALTDAVLRIAEAIRRGLQPDGLNVITSAGAAASQTILHLHVHLVPRWQDDQFGDIWPRPGPTFGDDAVDAAARSICRALAEGDHR